MQIRRRIGAVATSIAIAASGLLAFAPTASAAGFDCNTEYLVGSEGHPGIKKTCTSNRNVDRFRAYAECHDLHGNKYTHYGPIVWSGWASVVWCAAADHQIGNQGIYTYYA
ncbi:hypothetical protein [Streptomyces decoyicus]|uniref:hypothetical protein n=1 Tax=Streptomyces decoyicus TaxID=249567 RepID=UPI003827DABD